MKCIYPERIHWLNPTLISITDNRLWISWAIKIFICLSPYLYLMSDNCTSSTVTWWETHRGPDKHSSVCWNVSAPFVCAIRRTCGEGEGGRRGEATRNKIVIRQTWLCVHSHFARVHFLYTVASNKWCVPTNCSFWFPGTLIDKLCVFITTPFFRSDFQWTLVFFLNRLLHLSQDKYIHIWRALKFYQLTIEREFCFLSSDCRVI